MIPQTFDYSAPENLNDALSQLADGAKPLAGGHSLIPMMKLRLATPDRLVDLRRVAGLKDIKEEGGAIRIGAMATHHQIESSPVIRDRCPLLVEAAATIGDVQVRNAGTIGGSIAHADPAADWPASLQALEATVHLASASGERSVPSSEFFIDTFTTALEPDELVIAISVPVEEAGTGASYQKMVQPASGFAIVGIAARVRKEGGKVSFARVGVTGLAVSSYRAQAVEERLVGTAGSEEDIANAASVIADGADVNSDIHASADYRRRMAVVFAVRALRQALERAS